MALHDWNRDGSMDGRDDALEYYIYQQTAQSGHDTSGEGGCGMLFWIAVAVAVLSLLSKCGG